MPSGLVGIDAEYDERELNEVLSFNASIYESQLQRACITGKLQPGKALIA